MKTKDYKQQRVYLQAQAEQLAMQQDPRFREDPSEDRWLNESPVESPVESPRE